MMKNVYIIIIILLLKPKGKNSALLQSSATIRMYGRVALFDCDFDKLKSVFYSCIHLTMLISFFLFAKYKRDQKLCKYKNLFTFPLWMIYVLFGAAK